MSSARITVDAVAEQLAVDPKTVQRWLTGRKPHPRHRWEVAALLGEDEEYLWPPSERRTVGATVTDEVVAAYAHRALVPARTWRELLLASKRNIDLLGYAMLHLPEQHPDLMSILRDKAVNGCSVRIALADPESSEAAYRDAEERLEEGLLARIKTSRFYFSELDGLENVEIRLHATPMYNSIFRFDSEMFVTPHLFGIPGSKAPLFHLRRRGTAGIFDNFASHFEAIWEAASPSERNP